VRHYRALLVKDLEAIRPGSERHALHLGSGAVEVGGVEIGNWPVMNHDPFAVIYDDGTQSVLRHEPLLLGSFTQDVEAERSASSPKYDLRPFNRLPLPLRLKLGPAS
jgi:hypothetical protein